MQHQFIIYDLLILTDSYEIKANTPYILKRCNAIFYEEIKLKLDYGIKYHLIDNPIDKEWCIFICVPNDTRLSLLDIIKLKHTISYESIGYNLDSIKKEELINLYYINGLLKIDLNNFGLNYLYNKYSNLISNNETLFIPNHLYRIFTYNLGINNKPLDTGIVFNYIKKNEKYIIKQKCLVVSKLIIGYGGNQLTSKQLIETLEEIYNVSVLSIQISDTSDYSYKLNKLSNNVHPEKIIKLRKKHDIIDHINNTEYDLIINNKLNEFFSLLPFLNKKIDVITHNSMDIFNSIIIEHKHYINRIFTINKIHRDILYNYKLNIPIKQYINYVNSSLEPISRKSFTNKIVFVGRLSKEKNLLLLYDAFIQVSSIIPLELIIIGDGDEKYKKNHPNIKYMGYLPQHEIKNIICTCDYLVIPSYTEGLPFTMLEAMGIGIPCIGSDTNGINEIIQKNNGFLFKLEGYSEHKYTINNWNVYNSVDACYKKNKHYLINCLLSAYNISIETWNNLSHNSHKLIQSTHTKNIAYKLNLNNLKPLSNIIKYIKHFNVFINLKDNPNIPFGGGNISAYYIQKYLKLNNFIIHYELNENIDMYLIMDPLKNARSYKKYGLKEIVDYKNIHTPHSKVVIRVNDCDITRPNIEINKSREKEILKYTNEIHHYIFNSEFIYNYYKSLLPININYTIIFNGCNVSLFEPRPNTQLPNVLSIVTHHWSSNIYKGYKIYSELYNYCLINKYFKFIFIGNPCPEPFKNIKNIGPFCGKELAENLNENHIYITASKYDSCPNHVLEAIACGLPILYINCEGGGYDLCSQLKQQDKIGETFSTFEELIDKINLIKNNYAFYRNNVLKYRSIYNYQASCCKYIKLFKKILFSNKSMGTFNIKNKIPQSTIIINPTTISIYKNMKKHEFNLSSFKNAYIVSKNINTIYTKEHCITVPFAQNKLTNNLLNVLLCSDSNYFVGLFACLHSVLTNCSNINICMFNFIIPLECLDYFLKLFQQFKLKSNFAFNSTLVILEKDIIHKTILSSKCYNGGNHLLNIGNLSRLFIGEIFKYEILLYLDSDSIVQCDIYKKLQSSINKQCPYYGLKANVIGKSRQQNICLKLGTIIKTERDWKSIIGKDIDPDEWAFMGAPFIANTHLWTHVYNKIIQIIEYHNNTEGGLYNIFTMSLQNIIFYKQQNDISSILKCLCDCGSTRKQWDENDLNADILDWSGNYKPWFKNGLYRDKWLYHDILNLSANNNLFTPHENNIETFQ